MILLPSDNYSVEWSGRVWQTPADSNGYLVRIFQHTHLKSAKQQPLKVVSSGLPHPTQQVQIQKT
jgi:hypothetical protein